MARQISLWVFTSTLAIAFLAVVGFVFFTQENPPRRASLTPDSFAQIAKSEESAVNITSIYKNDLFDTYHEQIIQPVKEEKISPLPLPPQPQQTPVVSYQEPQFLPPLQMSLKGIIYSSDETHNRAVIMDNRSGREMLYQIGDKIEDAEIVRIGKNKVILIRSNGQQEILFVTQKEALADMQYNSINASWSDVVIAAGASTYTVDSAQFATRIQSLAQFIDMLDITTAFTKGKTIGCLVGNLGSESLGGALGLMQGDIITTINGISTSATKDRVAIYNDIKNLKRGSTIKVMIIRNQQEIELTYLLGDLQKESEKEQIKTVPTRDAKVDMIANRLVMESSENTGSQFKNIQKNDKQDMFRAGGRRSLLQRSP